MKVQYIYIYIPQAQPVSDAYKLVLSQYAPPNKKKKKTSNKKISIDYSVYSERNKTRFFIEIYVTTTEPVLVIAFAALMRFHIRRTKKNFSNEWRTNNNSVFPFASEVNGSLIVCIK